MGLLESSDRLLLAECHLHTLIFMRDRQSEGEAPPRSWIPVYAASSRSSELKVQVV